jgi:hypothetical protein
VIDRFIDSGAIFAGWVGLGVGIVVAIAFELIIPVQTVVFLLAPVVGVVIGVYANVRAERHRPLGRVLTNAAWAGIVSGVGLALFYVAIRLVFVYADSGALPDGTSLDCQTGPACIYQRYVATGQASELAADGITDAASLEAAVWRELVATGTGMVVLTIGGALIWGALRTAMAPRRPVVASRPTPG